MEIQQIDILLRLIAAHLLADFVFQTSKIVKGKRKGLTSRHFILHIVIVGLLTYILLADWTNWWAPLVMMVVHAFIDLGKLQFKKESIYLYLADQLLHGLSIIALWLLLSTNTLGKLWKFLTALSISNDLLLLVISYSVVSVPVAVFIGYLTQSWSKEIDIKQNDSLKNAGRTIGIIERILILTFVLLKQWAAIGFLLAAKSVFRFGDLKEGKDRKRTEYILIGTFMSFTFAILIGIVFLFLLQKVK